MSGCGGGGDADGVIALDRNDTIVIHGKHSGYSEYDLYPLYSDVI